MAEEARPMTVRVSQDVIDYRDQVQKRTGRKKSYIDQEVYDFYIEHHPLDDNSPNRKETT